MEFNTSILYVRDEQGNFKEIPALKGDSGVETSTKQPTDENIKVWINPDGGEDFNPNDFVKKTDILDLIYPVGAIYISANTTNPKVFLGGNWEKLEDRFLLGSGTKSLGATGGEETHTLTIDEMPSHSHQSYGWYNTSNGDRPCLGGNGTSEQYRVRETGGSQPHNNMPPYLVVNIWKRVS